MQLQHIVELAPAYGDLRDGRKLWSIRILGQASGDRRVGHKLEVDDIGWFGRSHANLGSQGHNDTSHHSKQPRSLLGLHGSLPALMVCSPMRLVCIHMGTR